MITSIKSKLKIAQMKLLEILFEQGLHEVKLNKSDDQTKEHQ